MASHPPTDGETIAIIERRLPTLLPPGWAFQRRPGGDRRRLKWDIASPGGETASFDVWIRQSAVGRHLDALLEASEHVPLVAAPFLSLTVREQLRSRRVSHADSTGNIWLVADRPGLFVTNLGATKEHWPTDDKLRSLRGRAAGRALRALVDLRPPYGLRDLALRATVPLGSLSRTLDLLDREELVTRGQRGGVADIDWKRSIRRWAQDYDFTRSNRIAAYRRSDDLDLIVRTLRRPKRPYAITGFRAAQHLLTGTPTGPMGLYVEDIDLAVERLRLEPVRRDSDADIILAEPYDSVAFSRTVVRDGLRLAAPSQLVADLLTTPGADLDLATAVLGWMSEHEDEWRG